MRRSNQNYKLREKFDIFDFQNRYVQIGFSTFTVVKLLDEGSMERILLHHRGNNVAESKNLINVVPAGAFQPLNSDENINSDELIANIVKEFGEELRGKDEYETIQSYELIKKDNYFNKIREGSYYLGCCLNPLNCHMELLILLKICITNEEYKNLKTNFEGSLKTVEFTKENLKNLTKIDTVTPALKEIAKIVHNNFEVLQKIPFNYFE